MMETYFGIALAVLIVFGAVKYYQSRQARKGSGNTGGGGSGGESGPTRPK